MSVETLEPIATADEPGVFARSGALRRLARDKVAAVAALALLAIGLIPGRALCDSWGLFNGTELRFDGLIRIEEASDECAAWNYANGLHERRASRSERAMF